MLRLKTFLDLSQKHNLSLSKNNSIDITKQQLNDVSSSFRQHLWDNLQDASETQTHCINHCLGNDDMPICDHNHRGCLVCTQLEASLATCEEVGCLHAMLDGDGD